MATTPTKPAIDDSAAQSPARVPSWPTEQSKFARASSDESALHARQELRPAGGDALQALLAFSAMHQQVRQRRALASRLNGFDAIPRTSEFAAPEFETEERFLLNEVLQ